MGGPVKIIPVPILDKVPYLHIVNLWADGDNSPLVEGFFVVDINNVR
jgi:hypothetical protein